MILIISFAICSLFSGLTHSPATGVMRPALTQECDGDACSQVTVTWDANKERYTVQNNSNDQWVRVEAANLAATATTCVGPTKEGYLSLKSIVGAYKAKFDGTCAPN